MTMRAQTLLVAIAILAAAPRAAHADKVDDQIALIDKKPAGMSNAEWRDKRRDAARELGRSGDKRAVDPLMKLAENEKFDAIGEIAIEGLGKLGDKKAVPLLKKIAADPSRDQGSRDAANDSLAQLGEGAAAPAPDAGGDTTSPPADTTPRPAATPQTETKVGGGDARPGPESEEPAEEEEPLGAVPVPQRSRFGGDVLAESERWTFALGSLAVAWDSVYDTPQATGQASAGWHRGQEKLKLGWSVDTTASFLGATQHRTVMGSDASSYSAQLELAGVGEGRFYMDPRGLFFHAGASLALADSAIKVAQPGNAAFKENTPSFDLGLTIGVGYGRTLDVGVRLRVKRIEAVLRRARLLGRPINADVAGRLQTAWWEARGSLGLRRQLAATVQILRETGVLLQDPDPTTVYQLLQVLGDGQLDARLDGWDVRLGVAELFIGRDNVGGDDSFDVSRQETALSRASFAKQLPKDSEVVATGRVLYRLTGSPGYVFADADVVFRRYFYADTWDPRGALELGGAAGIADSNTDDANSGRASHVEARAGWSWFSSRASRLTVLGTVGLEGSARFVLVEVRGNFSLSPATYAAW